MIGPRLTLHFNVLALGAQVPVSVCFCVSTRSLNRWRSVSNLVSFSRMFTSPSRCSMSASWLKTWTAVWPPLHLVDESGYERNRPQPSNPNRISIHRSSMSEQLQSLRADAARRRQQERGSQHGTPMPSPARARAVGRVVSHTERASIMDRVARTLFL